MPGHEHGPEEFQLPVLGTPSLAQNADGSGTNEFGISVVTHLEHCAICVSWGSPASEAISSVLGKRAQAKTPTPSKMFLDTRIPASKMGTAHFNVLNQAKDNPAVRSSQGLQSLGARVLKEESS